MTKAKLDKRELFASAPVGKALYTMAVPTIISQLVNLIYNMVDAFFIGRTGNSYMMAATSVTLTMVMMNVALSNLFGVGGGSLTARLLGAGNEEEAKRVSAFSVYGAVTIAVVYSALIGIFLDRVLRFLGASDATIDYARSYALIVIVIGSLPSILSLALAHLLRNAGYSTQASIGLSGGGILNVALDPLFMFVLLPRGQEVTGAALATTLSNMAACAYLLWAYKKAGREAPLSLRPRHARAVNRVSVKSVFSVGVPSALLTGLGIVMKVERIPNAINVGLCQGMMPIVAYNYSAGNHERMKKTINLTRKVGLIVSGLCILLFQLFADPASRLFLSTKTGDAETALVTVAYAALFLRIRCVASPVQMTNYHASYCMQAMGNGKATLLHAFVRELVFYIPLMFLLDKLFGEVGLASALPVGEGLGAAFALYLLHRIVNQKQIKEL